MRLRLFVFLYTLALGLSVGFHNEVETQLEIDRTSAIYRDRLHKGLDHFREWLRYGPTPSKSWHASVRGINQVLATYVNHCREHGVKPWLPKHAVLAFQTWAPSLRGHLHRPWDCLRTWKLQTYLGSRPPMPPAVRIRSGQPSLKDFWRCCSTTTKGLVRCSRGCHASPI